MDKFGVNTQRWKLATTPEEAEKSAKELSKTFSAYCLLKRTTSILLADHKKKVQKNWWLRHKFTQEEEERAPLKMDSKEEFTFAKRSVHSVFSSHSIRPAEAKDLAKQMLGHRLTTKQTHAEGVLVNKVVLGNPEKLSSLLQLMIAESLNFTKEKYFAILMDRATQGPVMVARFLNFETF